MSMRRRVAPRGPRIRSPTESDGQREAAAAAIGAQTAADSEMPTQAAEVEVIPVKEPSPPPTPRCEAMTVNFQTFLWLRDRRLNCDGVSIVAPEPKSKTSLSASSPTPTSHHHSSASDTASSPTAAAAAHGGKQQLQQNMRLPVSIVESLIDGDAMGPLVESCQPRGALDYALPLNARKAKLDDERLVRKAAALSSTIAVEERSKQQRAEIHDVRREKWEAIRQCLVGAANQVIHMLTAVAGMNPSISIPSVNGLVASQDVFDAVIERRDSAALAVVLSHMHDLWRKKEQSRPSQQTKPKDVPVPPPPLPAVPSPLKSSTGTGPPRQLPPLAAGSSSGAGSGGGPLSAPSELGAVTSTGTGGGGSKTSNHTLSGSSASSFVETADAGVQTDAVHIVSPKEYAALKALLAATERKEVNAVDPTIPESSASNGNDDSVASAGSPAAAPSTSPVAANDVSPAGADATHPLLTDPQPTADAPIAAA